MTQAQTEVQGRWTARPVLGAVLRVLALLGPVVVGLGVALLLARVLPEPATAATQAAWWLAVLAGSSAAVFATDRLARRLLPLAILLELSLIFPDKAPSRMRAARTASVRDIDARLARLRSQGVEMQGYDAAETVVTLVGILGLHDKRTRGHSERVRAFTDLLTAELGLDEDARVRLRWAALVHDLGKLTVPAPVLNTPGNLDEQAWALMHRHPDEGVRLLGGLLPWLGEWGDAVAQHHERYDGLGYPQGLAGEEISYAARIVALADSFEVMTSGRSYKSARSAAWARTELTRCAGSQFDPALVRAFLGISLGRLRWVLGPVTWLAELPFVATADRAGQTVKVASVSALAAGLLVAGAPYTAPVAPDVGSGEGLAAAERDGSGAGSQPLALRSDLQARDTAAARREASASTAPAAPATAAPDVAPDGAPQPGGTAGTATTGKAAPPKKQAPAPAQAEQPAPQQGPDARDTSAVAAAPAYHLTGSGLVLSPPARQEVVSAPFETALVFDRRLDRATILPNGRTLVLHARFPNRQGAAKIAVRLLDCSDSGACTVLSGGAAAQDKSSTDFVRYEIPLLRTGTAAETLAEGRILRVEVVVREPGAKAEPQLALGSRGTPSRLVLEDSSSGEVGSGVLSGRR